MMLVLKVFKQQMIVVNHTILTFCHIGNVNVHLQFENGQSCISTHKEDGIGKVTVEPSNSP